MPCPRRTAPWRQAAAALVVTLGSLLPAGALPGSRESSAHDQLDALLRVIGRLVRQKTSDRELQAARDQRVRVVCGGRQPSELRLPSEIFRET